MASLRHLSLAAESIRTSRSQLAGSHAATPTPESQINSPHSSRPSWKSHSTRDTDEEDDGDGDYSQGEESTASITSRSSSQSKRLFDDYEFIREIPECDMWEPIGDGPGKSFDFGASGWTGSMNVGHELLQITAPDSACGLVYVRGSFANDPDAILARAQRRVGGKSTFGLKVVSGDEKPGYELGRRGEEGLLNFRWPYIDFPLMTPGCDAGTCSKFTFISKGILYQVLRFSPGPITVPRNSSPEERNSKSKADGDANTQKRHGADRGKPVVAASKPAPWVDRSIKVRVGGRVRFGCPCQRKISQQEAHHVIETEQHTLTVTNSTYQQRLEICLFIDGAQVDLAVEKSNEWASEVDAVVESSFTLAPSKVSVVVATFKFCNKRKDVVHNPLPPSPQLRRELGVSGRSKHATDRVWLRQVEGLGGADYFDTCPAAACLEQILGVTAVPVRWKKPSTSALARRDGSDGGPMVIEKTSPLEIEPSSKTPTSPHSISKVEVDKQPSVDYIPVGDPTTDQRDPADIPLPLTRTESQISENLGKAASIKSVKSTLSSKGKGKPPDLAAGFDSSDEADEADRTDKIGEEEGDFSVAASRRSSSQEAFDSVARTSESPRSVKSKPLISLNTDPDFLTRSQSRVAGSEPDSPAGVIKARPFGKDEDDANVVGIALMGGCLGYQHVDLQRSMWQIRFLVKAHKFHSMKLKPGTPTSPSSQHSGKEADSDASLDKIRSSLISRIEYTLYHCLIWTVHVKISHNYFVTPATVPFKRYKRPDCGYVLDAEVEHDRTLYPPIVIWYVIRNCCSAVPQTFLRRLRKNLVRMRDQYQGDVDLSDPDHKAKLCILLWYFYGCLEKLCQEVFHTPTYDPYTTYTEEAKRKTQKRVAEDRERFKKLTKDWQRKAEKVMLASRKQHLGFYSDEYEIVDRLAFLGIELGLVSKDAAKQPSSCVYQARRRILERAATKELNPGISVPAFQSSANRTSIKAPWELTCLSHHGRLATALWDDAEIDLEDLQIVRNDYHRFLTSNFTYVGSWDLSMSAAETWWDLDATCVIGATRLDIRLKMAALEAAKKDGEQITSTKSPGFQPILLSPRTMSPLQLAEVAEPPRARADVRHTDDGILELLKKQIAQQGQIIQSLKSESDAALDYDWTLMEPAPVLQPNEWVHSLDDTPELFQSSQTKTIALRQRLLKYLIDSSKNEVKHKFEGTSLTNLEETAEKRILQPEWTPDTISDEFDIEELSNICVANIEVRYDGLLRYDLHGRLLVHEAVEDNTTSEIVELAFYDPEDNFNSSGPDADELSLDLWIEYLDGNLRKDNDLSDFFYDELKTKFQNLTQEKKDVLQDERIWELTQNQYKKNLLDCLNDSMVDCSARCRIYFIRRCTPSIVKACIYMWHTLAIDTFDDHFGDTSNFFDNSKEVWITSISISYWSFKRNFSGSRQRFDEGRDEAPFPPKKVIPRHKPKERWWKKINRERIHTKRIEERSSSLVMTGDTTGNWWMMSVISSVLPEAVLAKALISASSSMKEFIHQPATSRCLTFLFFLGLLCEHISEEYEEILKELTVVIKLGREVLKKGLEKTQAEDSIMRLKSMLWALEALRILDDRLGESIDKIDDAKVKMLKYISHGPGRRQEHLERQCQGLIEDFGKRYDRLASVHSKIEQKIVQITRYREGITAVSNLEDTHTALTQNETVRILTYITIAYLPISYIAAVFSMDIVTSAKWSAKIFAIMTAVFFISTLILARSLRGFIAGWGELGLLARGWKGRSRFFGGGVDDRESDDDEDTEDEDDEEESENDYDEEESIPPAEDKGRESGDGRASDDRASAKERVNGNVEDPVKSEKGKEKEESKWPVEYLRRRKKSVPNAPKEPSPKEGSVKAVSVKTNKSKDGSVRAGSVKTPSSRKASLEIGDGERKRSMPGSVKGSSVNGILK